MSLLILVKPMVAWIWAAAALMAFGSIVALTAPALRRRERETESPRPVASFPAVVDGVR